MELHLGERAWYGEEQLSKPNAWLHSCAIIKPRFSIHNTSVIPYQGQEYPQGKKKISAIDFSFFRSRFNVICSLLNIQFRRQQINPSPAPLSVAAGSPSVETQDNRVRTRGRLRRKKKNARHKSGRISFKFNLTLNLRC